MAQERSRKEQARAWGGACGRRGRGAVPPAAAWQALQTTFNPILFLDVAPVYWQSALLTN